MQNFSEIINIFLGLGTIIIQIFIVLLLVLFFFSKGQNKLLEFLKEKYLALGFIVTAFTIVFSFFYSEVLDYLPCYHCWIQRIFLVPQAILFAIALIRKESNIVFYSLALSIVGFVDSLYHNYLYYFKPDTAPCDSSGVSCVQRLVSVFDGYVSIPSMSMTIFGLLIVLSFIAIFYKNNK